MQISDNWGELLEPGLRTIFSKDLTKLKDFIPTFYNVESSTKAQEFTLAIGALGTMDEWTSTGNQVSYEDLYKGYKSTFTHKKYSKGIQIERELLDDDQYAEIKKRVRQLTQSVYYTKQNHAASVFNNAFNATYAGPDVKALCSATHPYSPSDATTQSNTGTTALSAAAVESTRNLMKAWKDDKGNLLAINPDTLVVPPGLRKAALVIADSTGEPDTADNNVNIWKGSIKVIEWDFLTDSTNWFMLDSSRMKNFLHWFNRRNPTLEFEKTFDTEVSKYKTVGRWSYGWDDWTWIYGHNVA